MNIMKRWKTKSQADNYSKDTSVLHPKKLEHWNSTKDKYYTDFHEDNHLNGPHGWLGAFIYECYVYPFIAALNFSIVWIVSEPLYNARVATNMVLTVVATIVLSILSIRTGRNLQNIRPDAVKKAGRLLITYFIWTLMAFTISLLLGFTNPGFVNYYWKDIGLAFLSLVLWRGYFEKSKRVKNTYPDYDRNYHR